jgi:cyclic pyranopterin phosphate synthase
MPLDDSGIWQSNLVFSKKEMIEVITNSIGEIAPLDIYSNKKDSINQRNADPAALYSFADGKGIVGFIPSITEPFYTNCDRIRLTSDGKLLTCLFEKPGHDLRNMLRRGHSDNEIKMRLIANVKKKPEGIVRVIRKSKLKPSLSLMHRIGG